MNYCYKCGRKVRAYENYCPNCGTKVKDTDDDRVKETYGTSYQSVTSNEDFDGGYVDFEGDIAP